MTEHVANSAKELEHMIGNPTELALALLQSDDPQRYVNVYNPMYYWCLHAQWRCYRYGYNNL
jgi:hypothetical protein